MADGGQTQIDLLALADAEFDVAPLGAHGIPREGTRARRSGMAVLRELVALAARHDGVRLLDPRYPEKQRLSVEINGQAHLVVDAVGADARAALTAAFEALRQSYPVRRETVFTGDVYAMQKMTEVSGEGDGKAFRATRLAEYRRRMRTAAKLTADALQTSGARQHTRAEHYSAIEAITGQPEQDIYSARRLCRHLHAIAEYAPPLAVSTLPGDVRWRSNLGVALINAHQMCALAAEAVRMDSMPDRVTTQYGMVSGVDILRRAIQAADGGHVVTPGPYGCVAFAAPVRYYVDEQDGSEAYDAWHPYIDDIGCWQERERAERPGLERWGKDHGAAFAHLAELIVHADRLGLPGALDYEITADIPDAAVDVGMTAVAPGL